MKVAVLSLALALTGGVTLAQEAGPTTTPAAVQVAPDCAIPAGSEPFLVTCVRATTVNNGGQFAGVDFYVMAADRGFVRLTECDDLIVMCETTYVRAEVGAEGVNQGDAIQLGPVE